MESLRTISTEDKALLRKTWEIASRDLEILSVDIFQMIFEQAPDAKSMFNFGEKDYLADERKSKEFTFHAMRFIQVIESTMSHLDDPESLDPLLLNLGKIHARYEEHLGFSSHYWAVFKECVLFHFRKAMSQDRRYGKRAVVLPPDDIDTAIILWREVLCYIINRMKEGLTANSKIRKANRESLHDDACLSVHRESATSSAQEQAIASALLRKNRRQNAADRHKESTSRQSALCRCLGRFSLSPRRKRENNNDTKELL